MRLLSVSQSIVIPNRDGPRYKFRQESSSLKFGRNPMPASKAGKSIPQQQHQRAALISPVKSSTRSSWSTSLASESEGPRRSHFADFSRRSSPGSTFVQGELLLEKVRVARNDLSETDLEIVPAQSKAPVGSGKLETKRPRHQWWRWICLQNASRLINAARALF
jgi:hypothetical protein